MEFIGIILVAAGTFFVCFLADKGFIYAFRNKKQHRSGLSVRPNRKMVVIGLLIAVLGIAAVVNGWGGEWVLLVGGGVLVLIGAFLVGYYMSFGVFYDQEAFVLTRFGRKSVVYRYGDIQSQQLFDSYGNIVIELHMADGKTFQLSSGMGGVYSFMDYAFEKWCEEKGVCKENCAFYHPENSCWFPALEG